MKCPGQDWRYWTGEIVIEAPCPECGYTVEFFKDEPQGRCPNCGHRFANPGTDFGCAQWCSLAEQCLGVAPEREAAGEAKEQALAGRIIQAVKEECQSDPARVAAALGVFRYTKWLVSREGGDPRVALAAALLLEIAQPAGNVQGAGPGDGLARVRALLRRLNVDEDTAGLVCRVIEGCRGGAEPGVIEVRIVRDAAILARLLTERPDRGGDGPEPLVAQLSTPAAKEAAERAFSAREPETGN